jgi:hypothetical protein
MLHHMVSNSSATSMLDVTLCTRCTDVASTAHAQLFVMQTAAFCSTTNYCCPTAGSADTHALLPCCIIQPMMQATALMMPLRST